MNIIKKLLINLLLILASVTFIFISLEVGLRFTQYRHVITRDELFYNYFKVDDVKSYDIKPNVNNITTQTDYITEYKVWSNELGCFDDPYKGEKDYILLVGDSFTHAYAPYSDKWGMQLEKILNFRVLKCGVTGYGTKQELLKAEDIISQVKVRPRLIVVGYYWNDLEDDYFFPSTTVVKGYLVATQDKNRQTGEFSSRNDLEEQFQKIEKYGNNPPSLAAWIKHRLKQNSIIAALSFSMLRRKADFRHEASEQAQRTENLDLAFLDYPWLKKAWALHLKNLQSFKQLALNNQAQLLMVIIPSKEQVYDFLGNWKGYDPEKPNKILHDFFNKEGIHYIDLLPLLRKYANLQPRKHLDPENDLYWRYDGHWNIKGNHLVGLLVANYILEHQLIQVAEAGKKAAGLAAELKGLQ